MWLCVENLHDRQTINTVKKILRILCVICGLKWFARLTLS